MRRLPPLSAMLLLLLAACQPEPPKAPVVTDERAEQQIMDQLVETPDDVGAYAALHGAAKREGATLTLTLNSTVHRFIDSGYCEGFDTCQRWRLDRLFGNRWVGLRYEHGEAPPSYFLLDRRGGKRMIDTEVRPVVSPDMRLALTGSGIEMNEPQFPGITIIDLDSGRLLFRDNAVIPVRLIGWRGPDCAAFATQQGASEVTAHVVREGGRWRITRGLSPAPCR